MKTVIMAGGRGTRIAEYSKKNTGKIYNAPHTVSIKIGSSEKKCIILKTTNSKNSPFASVEIALSYIMSWNEKLFVKSNHRTYAL